VADRFEISTTLAAMPNQVYRAWLDSEEPPFIGAQASIDARVGGAFTAWGDYIKGMTLELEVLLEPVKGGTRLTLIHSEIPDGMGEEYHQGWIDNYFEPMKRYFGS